MGAPILAIRPMDVGIAPSVQRAYSVDAFPGDRSMRLSVLLFALAAPATSSTACLDDAATADLAAAILAVEPAPAPDVKGSLDEALCTQTKLVAALMEEWGPPVGYKVGLTSAAIQERFGATAPVRGVLLRDMLLKDGVTVPVAFGARPLFETDLIVVVADGGINDATTPKEVARHISAVRPFIELPDLVVAEGQALDAAVLTAVNVGARLGVLGERCRFEDPSAMVEALVSMTVILTDGEGAELSSASGAAVLGNPLNAVIWLTESGVVLEPGDLVSVGSIGPFCPPRPGFRSRPPMTVCPVPRPSASASNNRRSLTLSNRR